jgi:hypothetical protein
MDPSRKNITVSVSLKAYKRAKVWAAHHNMTLSGLVSAFLSTVDVSKNAHACIGITCTQEELMSRLNDGK